MYSRYVIQQEIQLAGDLPRPIQLPVMTIVEVCEWTLQRTRLVLNNHNKNIQFYPLDLAKHDQVVALANSLVESKATIDCIIHNAGFNPKDVKEPTDYFDSTFYIQDFSAANVSESLFINALHSMELTGRLLPVLTKDAVVIAISSWLGSIGEKTVPGHYAYAGSKALMNMFIKGLSLEFAKDKHNAPVSQRTAIALNPGWMKIDMGGGDRADISPEEVASRILAMIDDGFFHAHNGTFLNTDRTEHAW